MLYNEAVASASGIKKDFYQCLDEIILVVDSSNVRYGFLATASSIHWTNFLQHIFVDLVIWHNYTFVNSCEAVKPRLKCWGSESMS